MGRTDNETTIQELIDIAAEFRQHKSTGAGATSEKKGDK